MLNLAKGLCAIVLPIPRWIAPKARVQAFLRSLRCRARALPAVRLRWRAVHHQTYDKEMWLHLCSDFSPQVVRVYGSMSRGVGRASTLVAMYYASDPPNPAIPRQALPGRRPVWDHNQTSRWAFSSANLYPACLDPRLPSTRSRDCDADVRLTSSPTEGPVARRGRPQSLGLPPTTSRVADNVDAWKLRGGIATGMAVFSYLQQRVTHPSSRACRRITTSASCFRSSLPHSFDNRGNLSGDRTLADARRRRRGAAWREPRTVRICAKARAKSALRRRSRDGHRSRWNGPCCVQARRVCSLCGACLSAVTQTEDSDENENIDHGSGVPGRLPSSALERRRRSSAERLRHARRRDRRGHRRLPGRGRRHLRRRRLGRWPGAQWRARRPRSTWRRCRASSTARRARRTRASC